MRVTVHRAGAVFTPQFAVMVNPPDPAAAARLRAQGGGARAFEWALSGMATQDPGDGGQTVDGLVETLVQQGLSETTARDLADQALQRGEVRDSVDQGSSDLPLLVRQKAQEEALSLNSAVAGGVVTVADMVEGTTPPLRTLYESGYPARLAAANLTDVQLLTNFPVATLAYGYTRGGLPPGQSRLVAFRERGTIRAYGSLTRTEALMFRLDAVAIHKHLCDRGFPLARASDDREARLAILEAVEIPLPMDENPQPLGSALLTLLHSFAHRAIRTLAGTAGIERDALAEYLLPHHLTIIVYAASRGEFVLGGLQALFETALDQFLHAFVVGERRCALDPGCLSGGGACMACLHLGEPSCRWFNRFLDRRALFAGGGFLSEA